MVGAPYRGPERRKDARPAAVERAEITMRLLITTERLERLTHRLEALVSTPPHPKEAPHDRAQ